MRVHRVFFVKETLFRDLEVVLTELATWHGTPVRLEQRVSTQGARADDALSTTTLLLDFVLTHSAMTVSRFRLMLLGDDATRCELFGDRLRACSVDGDSVSFVEALSPEVERITLLRRV